MTHFFHILFNNQNGKPKNRHMMNKVIVQFGFMTSDFLFREGEKAKEREQKT